MSNPAQGSFRIFSDRSASDLEAFQWNASMDLLACLTSAPDSTLSIYRLLSEDQSPKLLSEKIANIGTALCWSPCGRQVAVGDRQGCVTVYDSESGQLLRTLRAHGRAITALSWVDAETDDNTSGWAGGSGSPGPMQWPELLPPLLPVPASAAHMYAALPAETVETERFSLLISADDSGLVCVSAGGTFPLLGVLLTPGAASGLSCLSKAKELSISTSVDDPAHPMVPAGPEFRPVALTLAPDLRTMAVLLRIRERSTSGPGILPQKGSSGATDLVQLLDVRRLAVRQRELTQVSYLVQRLLSVIVSSRQAVEALGRVWQGATEGFALKVSALEEEINRLGDPDGPTIHQELLMACCTGTPSEAVKNFLTQETSPQQLSRIEKQLTKSLEYVNLVVCTRLQVAGQHMLFVLNELRRCAQWTQRFQAVGLHIEPLERLTRRVYDFLGVLEKLLLECSQARRFIRTLFQVLLRMSQRLAESAGGSESLGTSAAIATEDLDDFIQRMERRGSLELAEITACISTAHRAGVVVAAAAAAAAAAAKANSGDDKRMANGMSPGSAMSGSPQPKLAPTPCLAEFVEDLAAEAERISEDVVEAVSQRVTILASIPVAAPSPWASVSVQEHRDLPTAQTMNMSWDDDKCRDKEKGPCLVLLWSAGGGKESELHLCRIQVPPAPIDAPKPLQLERVSLRAEGYFSSPGRSAPAHFTLCQAYKPSEVVALVFQERFAPEGPGVLLSLIDLSTVVYRPVATLAHATTPPCLVTPLSSLPEGAITRSRWLPEGYLWSSSIHAMASRGVCSIYAWRIRRLITLDLEAECEEEEDEDDENDPPVAPEGVVPPTPDDDVSGMSQMRDALPIRSAPALVAAGGGRAI